MKIKIICISDNDKHWQTWIDEYTKRLGKYLEIINIKPHKNWTTEQIIEKDTQNIIKKIQQLNHYKILLDKHWIATSSENLAKIIKQNFEVVFIIWWHLGLQKYLIKEHIDAQISFGQITMPHWLAKLVLLEQIYRAWSINTWKKYHY